MAEQRSTAQNILAVQEGLAAAQKAQQALQNPASSGVLKFLSDGQPHTMDEIAHGQTLPSFKLFEVLKALETAGLVDVKSGGDTIELTAAGEAAASSI